MHVLPITVIEHDAQFVLQLHPVPLGSIPPRHSRTSVVLVDNVDVENEVDVDPLTTAGVVTLLELDNVMELADGLDDVEPLLVVVAIVVAVVVVVVVVVVASLRFWILRV